MINIPYFQEDKSLLIANDLLQNTDFKSDFIDRDVSSDGSYLIHITKPDLFLCNYFCSAGTSLYLQNDLDYDIGCLVILSAYGLGYFTPAETNAGFCRILAKSRNSRGLVPNTFNYSYYAIILAIEMDTQYLES